MERTQASKIRYDTLADYNALENLITEAESEDLFYECKSPAKPAVGQDIKAKLAKALSGFSNAEGGLLIYGIETQRHQLSSADVMVQITPIGNIAAFTKRIVNVAPTLTMPAITKIEHRVIKKNVSDSKGVLVIHIPQSSRPIQSLIDKQFWFRGGDQFVDAPYTVIERLFAANEVPDIGVSVEQLKMADAINKLHTLSFILQNDSAAAGRDISLTVTIINPDDTLQISSPQMNDASDVNNGKKIYTLTSKEVLHNGLNTVISTLLIQMKPNKRKLVFRVQIFADKMVSRLYEFECLLNTKSFKMLREGRVR